jgi:hypothetical protein
VSTLVVLADVADVIMFIDREESLGNKDPDILQIRSESNERYIKLTIKLEELLKKDKNN